MSCYDEAMQADEAYSAAIRAIAGPRVTRWTLSAAQANHPRVLDAYRRKVAADEAIHEELRKSRTTPTHQEDPL